MKFTKLEESGLKSEKWVICAKGAFVTDVQSSGGKREPSIIKPNLIREKRLEILFSITHHLWMPPNFPVESCEGNGWGKYLILNQFMFQSFSATW